MVFQVIIDNHIKLPFAILTNGGNMLCIELIKILTIHDCIKYFNNQHDFVKKFVGRIIQLKYCPHKQMALDLSTYKFK